MLIMIDSDCEPFDDFVSRHLRLHEEFPDVACIGGGIVGVGSGLWAKLDNVTSWVHSVPYAKLHEVAEPYHLPTTNMSVKVSLLPQRADVFDRRLNTGEDALLIRDLRGAGQKVVFSPHPRISHRDREKLLDVVRHHYAWGHHQYFVQLGSRFGPRCFNVWYRIGFVVVFLLASPLVALVGSYLNIRPWLRHKPAYSLFYPLMYLLWLAKVGAMIEAAIRPSKVIRT